jgi:hypothetical protein
MGFFTTEDDVRIFVKDWGPKDAQPIVFSPWLAAQLRRLGRPDALLPVEGLPRRRA